MKPLNYLALLMLPALVFAGFLLGGWFNFLVPAFCFFIHPAINSLVAASLPKSSSKVHQHYSRAAYRAVALSFVPVLLVLTCWSLYVVSKFSLSRVEFTGFALSVGIVNGVIGFTLAHEFIHRFSKLEKTAGYFLLLLNNYMHYGIEHVWGHHVYACTPKDPHTARFNESLYAYLPRAISSTYKNALEIEEKSMRKTTGSSNNINRLLIFALLQLALMFTVFSAGGTSALVFFLSQNIVAILLLHIINYLQHYGLVRKPAGNGSFEKMNAHHSWDSAFTDRSLFIFQLENHADHHLHPSRHFEQLSHHEEAPEHPAGYSFMVLLTLVPPFWFRVMNKRLLSGKLNSTA